LLLEPVKVSFCNALLYVAFLYNPYFVAGIAQCRKNM
jgi:hypothetical protein